MKVKIPILTYHSIDTSGSVISVAPQTFQQQMRFLNENGYTVLSLEYVIEHFNLKKTFAPKTVAITFDDGFRNFYTEAFPVLEKYNFTATVFLVTDFCGKCNDWAGNPPNLPRSSLLSWDEIKDLHSAGIIFGAHTKTHPDLTRLSKAQAEREIVESKKIIENFLGRKVSSFAYPYGKFNTEIRNIASENFRSACSVKLGKAGTMSDLFALERIDCYYLQHPKIFESLSTQAFDFYMQFRRGLREIKNLRSSQLTQ